MGRAARQAALRHGMLHEIRASRRCTFSGISYYLAKELLKSLMTPASPNLP
jgi:hypothetical protein